MHKNAKNLKTLKTKSVKRVVQKRVSRNLGLNFS